MEERKKKKENSTELQKPNVEAEFYNNFKENIFLSTFIPMFAFPPVHFPFLLIFNVYKSYSSTCIQLCVSTFSFLSSQHICQFCFHCFIPHLAPCFSFVFQFVFQLFLFLTGKYNFLFPFFARSIYCTLFLLDCFDFAYGYMYIFSHTFGCC